jgi:hypothetical protein
MSHTTRALSVHRTARYVGDELVLRSNKTFLTLRSVGAYRGANAPFARIGTKDVYSDHSLLSASSSASAEDLSSMFGALVSSYVTCVDRADRSVATTYLGLRVRSPAD